MGSLATLNQDKREANWLILRADLVTLLFFSALDSCRSLSYFSSHRMLLFFFDFCHQGCFNSMKRLVSGY